MKERVLIYIYLYICVIFLVEIIGLISDMHASASQIIDYYTSKVSSDHSGDSLNSNPAKLCFVVKQSVRETAVGEFYFFLMLIIYLFLIRDFMHKSFNHKNFLFLVIL